MTAMPDNSTLVLTEDGPARALVAAAGIVNPASGKVHALRPADGSPSLLVTFCGLGSPGVTPEISPWPATVDCARCVTLVASRVAGQEAMADNPHALRARIAELEASVAEERRRLAAVVATAAGSLSQMTLAVRDARQESSLWRSIAAGVLVSRPDHAAPGQRRHRASFTALEAAAVRAGVPWAEASQDEDGGMTVTAFLSLPDVSSGHGSPGGGRQPEAATGENRG